MPKPPLPCDRVRRAQCSQTELRLAQAVESQFETSVVAAFEAILAGANGQYRAANRRVFECRAQATAVEAVSVGYRRSCQSAACVRERTPSLAKMCRMWTFTVERLTHSARAISSLVSPCLTS